MAGWLRPVAPIAGDRRRTPDIVVRIFDCKGIIDDVEAARSCNVPLDDHAPVDGDVALHIEIPRHIEDAMDDGATATCHIPVHDQDHRTGARADGGIREGEGVALGVDEHRLAEQAGQWAREGLAIYRELGHQQRIPRLLNLLGIVAIMQEDYGQAEAYWEEGLSLIQEMGDRLAMADVLNNLGYINHHNLQNLEKAKRYYIESLSIGREIGHRQGATSTLSNLGHLHILLGEHALAWEYLREALSESMAIGLTPLTLDALAGVALLRSETGQADSAAEMVGLIVNHPSVGVDSVQVAETILDGLRDTLVTEQLEAALERGKTMELNAIVAELLAE